MAELKRQRPVRARLLRPRFHGITAVAVLKLGGRRRPVRRLLCFHGITAVAELKPMTAAAADEPKKEFPRHHSRGRIEAWRPATARCGTTSSFHGITAVAELKRDRRGRDGSRTPGFHGITAVAELKLEGGDTETVRVLSFHGITAVAELKPGRPTPARRTSRCFHGITAVAELKPPRRTATTRGITTFPRHHSRGRIEARPG